MHGRGLSGATHAGNVLTLYDRLTDLDADRTMGQMGIEGGVAGPARQRG